MKLTMKKLKTLIIEELKSMREKNFLNEAANFDDPQVKQRLDLIQKHLQAGQSSAVYKSSLEDMMHGDHKVAFDSWTMMLQGEAKKLGDDKLIGLLSKLRFEMYGNKA